MIDENRLIEDIFYVDGKRIPDRDCAGEPVTITFEGLYDIIKNQPKVNEWIPVEERLPEQSLNSVIGWDAYRERRCFVQYYMNEWILGNHETVKIIAWMPVPEPYKKEKTL